MTRLTTDGNAETDPAVSPDGSRIAYEFFSGIWVMNSDGTGKRRLTSGTLTDSSPAWSADGTKIAFSRRLASGDEDIFVMNADGTGQKNLTNTPSNQEFDPAFSPKAERIAYTRTGCEVPGGGGKCVYAMNSDGSGQADLGAGDLVPGCPSNSLRDFKTVGSDPSWSPDGTTIAFSGPTNCPHTLGLDIWLMNADGSGKRNLIGDNGTGEVRPAFSSDGQKIVFQSDRDSNWPELYTMSAADGSGMTRLTTNSTFDENPDWQPIPECTKTVNANNDPLIGTSGKDVLCGDNRNNTIKGAGGNDIILGQGGNDRLTGVSGNDTINGGPGNDTALYPGSTAVKANLTTGFASGVGSDVLLGVENLTGSNADDQLRGSSVVNVLVGGKGADSLFGLGGGDTLNSKDGINGNDSLDGGPGKDNCITDATEKSIKSCP